MDCEHKNQSVDLDKLEKEVVASLLNTPALNGELPLSYLLSKGAARPLISAEILEIAGSLLRISETSEYASSKKADAETIRNLISETTLSSQSASSLVENTSHHTLRSKVAEATFFGSKAKMRYIDSKEILDQITYTIIRNRDYKLVREVYFQALDSEESLGSLARKYSAGPEKHSRGIVGPISLAKAHPEIRNRIKKASTGQIIKPFYVEGWWICIRIEHRVESLFTPELEQLIANQMLDDWIDTLCDRVLEAKVSSS